MKIKLDAETKLVKIDHAEDCIVNLFFHPFSLVLISFLSTISRKMAHTYSDFYQRMFWGMLYF